MITDAAAGKQSALLSAAAVASAVYLAFRAQRALSAHPLPKRYSVELPGQEDVDEGGRARANPDPGTELLLSVKDETVWSLFEKTARQLEASPCHGTLGADKAWSWLTYGQVHADIVLLGAGLAALGLLTPAKGDASLRLLGVFGPNTSEWMRSEYACLSRGGTVVPLYATLSREGVVHALNLTGVSTVSCTSLPMAYRVLDARQDCPGLGAVLVSGGSGDLGERVRAAEGAGVRVVTLDEVREAGRGPRGQAAAQAAPLPSTCFTFCFTSGSTGPPKGALLTHANMVYNMVGTLHALNAHPDSAIEFGKEYYLSYLPLAHQMERLLQAMMYYQGGRVGFSRGDPALVMEDVALLRPTVFASVPRVLVRLHDGLQLKARQATGARAGLLALALRCKLADLAAYGHVRHPVWDALVFDGIARKLGLDRCKVVPTGSAPIPPRVLDVQRVVLRARVNEGYGQTECTCSLTLCHPGLVGGPEERVSHVGAPIIGTAVKLRSVPEMQYLVSDRQHGDLAVVGRGEVLTKGLCVMSGYFAMPDKTRATLGEDGWLRTGDVGAWLPNGTLTILDRANNIFKLSQGEYVHPDKVERALARCPVVAASFVFGTTLNSKLVAIIVVSPDFPEWCGAKGVDPSAPDKARALVLQSLRAACLEAGLMGYEIPAGVTLHKEPFTVESGVLTATFKIVRNVAKEFYKSDLLRMYEELGEPIKL
jgi:long-chain acyl-CoA synthetase